MTSSPYTRASPEKLAEIIRQAESTLDAQLTIALAADQRALTFAGLLVAAIAAALGVTTASGNATAGYGVPLTLGCSMLFVAAALAMWSARPVSWETKGNSPSNWLEDLQGPQDDMHVSMAVMAEYYAEMISMNAARIDSAGKIMEASVLVTIGTLAVGIVFQFVKVM